MAIAEIDRVIARWGLPTQYTGRTRALATDTLERYRANLIDPTYLTNFDVYFADPVKYGRQVEKELEKTVTFEQAWPQVIRYLEQFHYE